MKEERFAALLAPGYESLDVEFKGPGRQDDRNLFGKVVRAALGMANLRKGGLVIIGVSEQNGALDPVGLTEDQLKSWSNFDVLSEKINNYASPCVVFDLEAQEYQGNQFLVLVIQEFRDIPVLCCRDYADENNKKPLILRASGCYARSRHKRETAEIRSEEEMRELLDLAIEKGVWQFLERAKRVGLYPLDHPTNPQDLSEKEFEDQRNDFQ